MSQSSNRILYHASTVEIESPLTNVGRKDLDFGPGFYVTKDFSQAEKWAQTVALRKNGAQAIVNYYEFDEERFLSQSYARRYFDSYSLEWLDFIAESRKGGRPWTEYDWIEGGIANDKVISTVDAYVDGFINAEQALDRLVNEELRYQICISRQEIVDRYLRFRKSAKV